MALWTANGLASSMERDRLLGLCCVLAGAALWLATPIASAGSLRSMSATVTTDSPGGSSLGDRDTQSIAGGQFGGHVRVNATTDRKYCRRRDHWECLEGYEVDVTANATLSANAVIDPDQSGSFDVWIDLRAKIDEPGSLRDFPNWPATASYQTIIDLDLPDGGKIAFLGDQRPKVSGNGHTLTWTGSTYLGKSHSLTTFRNSRGGSVIWTTSFDSDGNPVFSHGTSTNPISPAGEDNDPETALGNEPVEVTGAWLISGNQFLAPVDEGYGTEDPIYFDGVSDEPDEPTMTRSAEGYAVVGMEGTPQFASFGIPDLDPQLGYQVDIGDVTLDVAGSEVVDFLTTNAEGVTTFLVRGLEEQTTEGIPNLFKMTFVEDGTAAFSVFPLVLPIEGDFNKSGFLDAADLDLQAAAMNDPNVDLGLYDENKDGVVDQTDRWIWVHDRLGTWIGDSDANGQFDSSDFVQVFQAGTYETEQYAGWSEGDWNGDGIFNSGDFVIAFQDGGYEKGPRMSVAAVPEPRGWLLLALGLSLCLVAGRRRCPV